MAALGPISALHWNACGGVPEREAGDFLTINPASAWGVFDIAIAGLLGAVQAALSDLKRAGEGAVLVTNGAFADTTMPESLRWGNVRCLKRMIRPEVSSEGLTGLQILSIIAPKETKHADMAQW